ncbi:hypothetical protein GCM10010245_66360 [Streptomyces spectabilis]|uniref:Signal transduction histidine kinase n=1 Tax=Streptomyces spectabilis TaxID=68270 RepID=A0A7W8B5A0_STRST|nr:signal transduction histidine kinase [Streptomyces spectabilis]GGV42299.1 hypothetical protein GCM10010245_66360 [Streptomyces spectabilis]
MRGGILPRRRATETLANVRKHAQTSVVCVHLDYSGRDSLKISDDGAGFNAENAQAGR